MADIGVTDTAHAGAEADALPNIVSVDDHVVEPPTLWTDRLPSRYRDLGPRVVRESVRGNECTPASGEPDARPCDVWYYEDVREPMQMFHASVGFAPGDVDEGGITYDQMRRGCFDPQARLEDMDTNGVDASLAFPNVFVRFCGQRFLEGHDRQLALACVRAYNDYLAEEWQAADSARLFGVGIVPLWDVDLAAEEVRRNATRGILNVAFSEIPAWLGLPSLYVDHWDPFFRACAETSTVVQMHIGSSSNFLTTSADAPRTVPGTNLYLNSSLGLTDLLVSGVLAKFPALEVAFAESQAGWMPYVLERLDNLWGAGFLFHDAAEKRRVPEPPSTYFKRQVYACIYDDGVAVGNLLDRIGVDRICFETDYPHPDGTWPNSKAVAARLLAGVGPDVRAKVLRTNAMRMLKIEPA